MTSANGFAGHDARHVGSRARARTTRARLAGHTGPAHDGGHDPRRIGAAPPRNRMHSIPQLDSTDVRRLLPMAECIDVMADAFSALGRGDAVLPLRTVVQQRDGAGALYVMPALLLDPHAMAVKLITIVRDNQRRGLPTHQGVIIVFDTETGSPAALLDAESVTAIRTAAVSALATRLAARADTGTLALIGSGVQAASHLEAMLCVCDLRHVRVYSPHREHRESFAERQSAIHGIHVEPVESARAAVDGADLICTLTASATPVIEGSWIAPGAHINAIGASSAATREVDTGTVRLARIFVDSREAALAEAGDLLIPLGEGAIDGTAIIAELADLVLHRATVRQTETDITLFKSVGLAIEDAAAATRILMNSASPRH
jgi:ornithine cyclodeaminase/alanine dehydrogenase-like protein (mu-crystallin family)